MTFLHHGMNTKCVNPQDFITGRRKSATLPMLKFEKSYCLFWIWIGF